MSDAASPARPGVNRQLLLFGALFLLCAGALAIGYFLFLRPDYVVLAQDLRPADAGAVVAELDKRRVDYKLKDGGTTILVPSDQADATRLAISGSDAMARGQIGFELFNKSDMGLTNFAQKINYQRALQGELVRTITQIAGVESARVHLGLPERALFRGDRTEPTAAVTLTMRPGLTADPARVLGIQQLVAAAVPDLPQSRVVVLDADGRVISVVPEPTGNADSMLDEQHAIQAYYAARVRAAAEPRIGGQRFAVRALVLPIASGGAAAGADWAPSGEGASRNFRLRILIVTAVPLPGEDQAALRDAIARAVALDPTRGDDMAFEVGPVDPVAAPAAVAANQAAPAPGYAAPGAAALPASPPTAGAGWFWVLALAAFPVLAGMFLLRRRGGTAFDGAEHEAFAGRLRRQLNLAEGTPDAAR